MMQRIALAGMLMMGLGLLAPAPLQAEPAVNEYPGLPGSDRHDPPVKRLPGEISFETYRMLSTGTTEAEILTRAGQPRYTFRIARGTWVWVYLNDEWLVEVTFSGGRVANISRYRPKP
jgi:hypothetical protein